MCLEHRAALFDSAFAHSTQVHAYIHLNIVTMVPLHRFPSALSHQSGSGQVCHRAHLLLLSSARCRQLLPGESATARGGKSSQLPAEHVPPPHVCLLSLAVLQLDFAFWVPNCPVAMLRPPPQAKGAVTEDDIMSFLPDVNTTCRVLMALNGLSQPAINFVRLRPLLMKHLCSVLPQFLLFKIFVIFFFFVVYIFSSSLLAFSFVFLLLLGHHNQSLPPSPIPPSSCHSNLLHLL